jgi:hypothetical protein
MLCESQAERIPERTSEASFIIDLVAAESSRWKSISFVLSPTLFSRLAPIRGRLDQLESLKLGVPYQVRTRDLLQSDFDMFVSAPKLSRVHIANPLEPSIVRIPWNQVTHYATSSTAEHIPTLFQILPQLPNLVSLHIEPIYGAHSLQRFEQNSVVLNTLKELTVIGQPDSTTVGRLFSALSAPAINSISLQYLPTKAPSFIRWFSDSAYNVTALDLCYLADLTQSTLIQCLEATPSLLSFTYKERVGEPITWTNVVSRRLTIQTMAPSTTQPLLLPQLKHMILSFIRPELDQNELFQMIESRWRARSFSDGILEAGLYSIRLDLRFPSTPTTSAARARIKEFEKEGLWIST